MKFTPEQILYFREDYSAASKYLYGIDPEWYQSHMIQGASDHRFIMWICCRGLGKSFGAADLLLLDCGLYNNVMACVYGKDYNYTKATFSKIEKIYDESAFLRSITCGPPKIQKEFSELKFKNGSKLRAEPFKRGRRWHDIFLDEAREIEIPDLSTIILPMLSEPHPVMKNKLILASSATYANEPLHKLWLEWEDLIKKGEKDYFICSFDVYDALESKYMDRTIVENAKKIMLEEEFQIEFENQWVNLAGGWIKGPLIRSSELDYPPQFYGNPGELFVIGLDFGRASNGDATSATVTKIIPGHGVNIVRNVAVTGMPIPQQATLIKQLWKDYGGKGRGEVIKMPMDNEKLGYAVADSLKLISIDPRDGEELPSIIDEEDRETEKGIRIIKPINFADKVDIYIRASKMKKGFESGILHLPKDAYRISMSEAEKLVLSYEDREIINACEEISELKREMCNVEVQPSGTVLTFKRNSNRKDKKDRFTSAFLSSSEALDYYDSLNKQESTGIGVIC
jgi:hypothetical protein